MGKKKKRALEEVLNLSEVADMLGVSRPTARRQLEAAQIEPLPTYGERGQIQFYKADVDEWIEEEEAADEEAQAEEEEEEELDEDDDQEEEDEDED